MQSRPQTAKEAEAIQWVRRVHDLALQRMNAIFSAAELEIESKPYGDPNDFFQHESLGTAGRFDNGTFAGEFMVSLAYSPKWAMVLTLRCDFLDHPKGVPNHLEYKRVFSIFSTPPEWVADQISGELAKAFEQQ